MIYQALFLYVAFFAYVAIVLPGLDSAFVLDDFPNLARLSEVKTTRDIWPYVFGGISGPLSRALAYLTFAWQADAWPGNPFPFKLANVGLHLLNALLVYYCCFALAKNFSWPQRQCFAFAAIISIYWLYLAINLGTVLYVVQRMAMLSAFFCLLGIALFLYGFKISLSYSRSQGITIATLGMTIGYGFGLISKENAILLGLYVAILYGVLLRPTIPAENQRPWDIWCMVAGLLPPTVVFVYLFCQLNPDAFLARGFSVEGRLLTECMALWDYADKVLIPTPHKLNINNDNFPVARGLTDPIEALLAVSAWGLVLTLALFKYRAWPFYSVAALWFLAGHSLEATIVPLELYFEHRNYLPSLGLLIGLVGGSLSYLNQARKPIGIFGDGLGIALKLLIIVLIAWNALVTRIEAKIWGDPALTAMAALSDRPNSLRAWQSAAEFFSMNGDYLHTSALLYAIEGKWSGYPGTYLQIVMMSCWDARVKVPIKTQVIQRLRTGRFDRMSVSSLDQMLKYKKKGACHTLSWNDYHAFIEALIANPKFALESQNLIVLLAYSYNAEGRYQEAAQALDRVPEAHADIGFYLLKSQFYAYAGRHQEALDVLARAKMRFSGRSDAWLPNAARVDWLEKTIRKEAQ